MKVVAAVNPTRDLPFSDAEADHLGDILPLEDLAVLRGSDATKAAVQALVGSATHLHFACHGQHDPIDIMQSGLVLSDGVLTLNSILGDALDLTCVRLVMLSACDTGLNELKGSPDEFIGLPAAFLEGGACGVLSTLWPVADRATSLLVLRFYRAHLIEGMAPAQALRSAQLWLKSATVSELAEFYLSQEGADTLERQEAFLELTLGGDANERPYQAPCYWGAFQYTGV
jgi:CHAT domain-containing protein